MAVGGYLIGGLLSASLVGVGAAALGVAIRQFVSAEICSGLVLTGILVLVLRETDVIRFQLPMAKRQTVGWWYQMYGLRKASLLWGLDIGLGFSTWIAFGGWWAMILCIVYFHNLAVGVALCGGYWLGRAIPTILAPEVSRGCGRHAHFARCLGDAFRSERQLYVQLQQGGLVVVLVSLVFTIARHSG